MRPDTMSILFLFLVSLVSAAPITTGNESHLDTVFSNGIISGSSPYTTRFSTQIPSVPLKKRLQQRLKKEKRRTKQLFGWMWSYIEAAQERERDDIYLLRALEDPVFLAAYSSGSSTTSAQRVTGDEKLDGVLSRRASAELTVRDIVELANSVPQSRTPKIS
ncbi:hypothetical protein HYPSUDRAFT_89777 [Hypholoma sublateritium FD-334 SS-4]|uniref:Uncharacterized protein n=1 Tax=Hypholoma sublateritium (strain FD-334 SS-4) TaxID=945553 RepID=A0A0D2NIN9_HYPSF|nr:hypothetical protein HYPSUDRAFT_89777 [Hypholoma sublateritium FD-334 SS-4]